MNAVGYARVSTEGQAENGVSLEMQRAKIETYCRHHDVDLSEVIVDAGYSAKNLKRPGAQRVMAMVDAREIEAVVVYKLDRLSRSTRDTLELIERFNEANVAFHSIEEKLDTKSAMGEFVLTILAALGQMERRMISDRTQDSMRYAKTQGKHLGRVGFHCAETVNEMRALRAQGFSYDDIARGLNARQVPTDRGGEWKGNTVRRILNRAA
jgi:DNA invertase Pin-like site-specific DNA recombinase